MNPLRPALLSLALLAAAGCRPEAVVRYSGDRPTKAPRNAWDGSPSARSRHYRKGRVRKAGDCPSCTFRIVPTTISVQVGRARTFQVQQSATDGRWEDSCGIKCAAEGGFEVDFRRCLVRGVEPGTFTLTCQGPADRGPSATAKVVVTR